MYEYQKPCQGKEMLCGHVHACMPAYLVAGSRSPTVIIFRALLLSVTFVKNFFVFVYPHMYLPVRVKFALAAVAPAAFSHCRLCEPVLIHTSDPNFPASNVLVIIDHVCLSEINLSHVIIISIYFLMGEFLMRYVLYIWGFILNYRIAWLKRKFSNSNYLFYIFKMI